MPPLLTTSVKYTDGVHNLFYGNLEYVQEQRFIRCKESNNISIMYDYKILTNSKKLVKFF